MILHSTDMPESVPKSDWGTGCCELDTGIARTRVLRFQEPYPAGRSVYLFLFPFSFFLFIFVRSGSTDRQTDRAEFSLDNGGQAISWASLAVE